MAALPTIEVDQSPAIIDLAFTAGDDFAMQFFVEYSDPLIPVPWPQGQVEAHIINPRDPSFQPIDFQVFYGPGDGDLELVINEVQTATMTGRGYMWYLVLTIDEYTLTYAKGQIIMSRRTNPAKYEF